MADHDRYPRDERGRHGNRADGRNDDDRDSLDDRNGYGVGSGYGAQQGGLFNDRSYGAYGGGGGDYDGPRYGGDREQPSFSQQRSSPRHDPRPSPRGGTYAYGAEDSGRGYRRQYDPYLDRNEGYESRQFNPYEGTHGGSGGRGGHGGAEPADHRGFWQKATDEVSSWMGDPIAASRRREDMTTSHYGKGKRLPALR